MAQPGSAPALGAGSRRFKSSRPDHKVGFRAERRDGIAAEFLYTLYSGLSRL